MPRPAEPPDEGTSRRRVLQALRTAEQPLRGDELATRVGLSLNAVRFHLDRLIAEGAVRAGTGNRDRPGRPPVVYRAVPAEAVDAASAYRLLAGILAGQLTRSGDHDAAERAGRAWAAVATVDAGASDGAQPGTQPSMLSGPAAVVLNLLDDGGFEPWMSPDHTLIELRRCPFLSSLPSGPRWSAVSTSDSSVVSWNAWGPPLSHT